MGTAVEAFDHYQIRGCRQWTQGLKNKQYAYSLKSLVELTDSHAAIGSCNHGHTSLEFRPLVCWAWTMIVDSIEFFGIVDQDMIRSFPSPCLTAGEWNLCFIH